MKNSILITGLCLSAVLLSQPALAEVKIRAGGGSATYELGGDYTHAKSTYNPTSIGLTLSSDTSANGAYIDFAYASGTGHHNGWANANVATSVCAGGNCNNVAAPNEPFKRSDWAVTGGVVFLNQNNGVAGNVYVGVKGGTTTLDAQHAAVTWTQETFTSTGVVFGGGASFPVAGGRAGSLGVNAGLGIMGATWKDNNPAGNYSAKANTAVGGSLGVNYTFPFTRNFGVTADYKYQSYSYKFGTTANPFTVSEKFSTLMGILYAKF